ISRKKASIYEQEIRSKISTAAHAFGYYHPDIKIEYDNRQGFFSTAIKAVVDLGKPLFIRNCDIQIIGEGIYYQSFHKIVEQSRISSYKPLRHGDYEKLKEDLKKRSLELGFFDAKFITSRILVYKEQNAADIQIIFDTGKRYFFGDLILDENSRELMTPSEKIVPFKDGDYFSQQKINEFTSSLSQTNYYSSVDVRPSVEKIKDSKVPVTVKLERQKSNLFRVGLGYSTDEQIRGILAWDKPLINSEGHSFSSFVRMSGVKQDAQAIYKIPYRDPNLDYFYVKLAQVHTDYNDTLSDMSHGSLHYVSNMSKAWRRDFYLAVEYEKYTQALEHGYAFNVMPGFTFSRRNTTGGTDPKTGYSIVFDNRFGSKLISDENFWHTVLSLKGICSPSENTRLLFRFTQGAIIGSNPKALPPSMRFFVGGEKTLRGFSYKSESSREYGLLTGSRYMTAATTEFMFPTGIEDVRASVFVDSAVCTNSYADERNVLFGPGIGIRYITSYGIFKADVAYGIDNHNDRNQFKLHLSFGPEF
ncbi:MAG: autotransporter assembly complex family protein, partial [Succinivibrio sp.]